MEDNPTIQLPMQRSALAFHINNIHKAVKESKLQVEEQCENRHD